VNKPPVEHLGVKVPAALNRRLEAQAARENNHVSATVRRLITKQLDVEEAAARRASKRRGE
jgi:hypothetical protein